jgi:hypothetical protein
MKPIKYWTDLYGIMPNHTILAYSRIYEDPEVLQFYYYVAEPQGVVFFPC